MVYLAGGYSILVKQDERDGAKEKAVAQAAAPQPAEQATAEGGPFYLLLLTWLTWV